MKNGTEFVVSSQQIQATHQRPRAPLRLARKVRVWTTGAPSAVLEARSDSAAPNKESSSSPCEGAANGVGPPKDVGVVEAPKVGIVVVVGAPNTGCAAGAPKAGA
jgi:hypothetical protein